MATADTACVVSDAIAGEKHGPRLAQTFRALRSGRLTSATVFLDQNSAGAQFTMEIRPVDQTNAPSAVLASTTIANVPATVSAPGNPRTLTGAFAAPATVVAGVWYALVIAEQTSNGFYAKAVFNDVCPDGNRFRAGTGNGAFTSFPTQDLRFETVVTG